MQTLQMFHRAAVSCQPIYFPLWVKIELHLIDLTSALFKLETNHFLKRKKKELNKIVLTFTLYSCCEPYQRAKKCNIGWRSGSTPTQKHSGHTPCVKNKGWKQRGLKHNWQQITAPRVTVEEFPAFALWVEAIGPSCVPVCRLWDVPALETRATTENMTRQLR